MRRSSYLALGAPLVVCSTWAIGCSDSGTNTNSRGGAGTSGAQNSSGGTFNNTGGTPAGSGGAAAGNVGSGGSVAGSATSGGTGGTSSGSGGGGGDTSAGSGGGGGIAGSSNPDSKLGTGVMMGSGTSSEQFHTAMVSRDDTPYIFITNGWGPNFDSHTISWEGTGFTVESMSGSRGGKGEPASYPTVFCGRYSVQQVPDCGLPAAISSITTLRTGWRWAANGNTGTYNAAYDIWVYNGNTFGGYLMVWLRDPPGEQPAGSPDAANQGVTVQNVPGTWNIWTGTVNGRPITNWVRPEGMDSPELEFDVMDFIRDAETRGVMVPGDTINAVAVGFEIWEGPITNLQSVDFYVEVN